MLNLSHRSALLSVAVCAGLFVVGCVFSPRPQASYEANSQVQSLRNFVVYQDSSGALSYHSQTAQGIAPEQARRVHGRACQHALQFPLIGARRELSGTSLSAGWGQGAYGEALDNARQGLPAEALLFDVRADINTFMILTVYRKQCLEISAAVAMPVVARAPNPPVLAPVPPVAPAEGLPAPTPAPVDAAAPAPEGAPPGAPAQSASTPSAIPPLPVLPPPAVNPAPLPVPPPGPMP